MLARIAVVAALVALAGCSKDEKPPACTPGGTSNCEGGQVCELVAGTTGGKCFDPLVVRGRIYDLADDANVSGARVTPLDVDGAPAASTVTSASTGDYSVRVFADRNADGSPAAASVTLRVEAASYQSFPSGLRVALPIALDGATHDAGVKTWIVDESLTDVGLLALAGAPAGQIHGTAAVPAGGASILVVADCAGVGFSSIASSNGAYRIFNVPDGACTVRGYTEGKNYTPVEVTVASGSDELANLSLSATSTATVTGGLQYVSGAFDLPTSVILVVTSTFDAATARGTAPAGLRAGDLLKGDIWSIAGVPDGRYFVLAAFETDYLLRDPADPILELQVADGVVSQVDGVNVTPWTGSEQFKITSALRLKAPLLAPLPSTTAPCSTLVSFPDAPGSLRAGPCSTDVATPSIAWEKVSSVKKYLLQVVDELGTIVWAVDLDPSAEAIDYGSVDPTLVMSTITAAQPLVAGRLYQVRITALDTSDAPVAASEDLLGVFQYAPAP